LGGVGNVLRWVSLDLKHKTWYRAYVQNFFLLVIEHPDPKVVPREEERYFHVSYLYTLASCLARL